MYLFKLFYDINGDNEEMETKAEFTGHQNNAAVDAMDVWQGETTNTN